MKTMVADLAAAHIPVQKISSNNATKKRGSLRP
jgi:hypothetical protein